MTPSDTGPAEPAALAFRAHSGWAVAVAVRCTSAGLEIIQRTRIELADRTIAGSMQPYHAAKTKTLQEAEAFLSHCAQTGSDMAQRALREMIADLLNEGLTPIGFCVLWGSGKLSVDLATTLRSHAAIHTAEGEFFRQMLKAGCEACGGPVFSFKEKTLWTEATTTLSLSAREIQDRVAKIGKRIGPPWRQDEKLCTLAAWMILSIDRTSREVAGRTSHGHG